MDIQALDKTEFTLPGQSALYHGKVRDVYEVGDTFISVATDRISAFDVILPRAIPYKGQVLNETAAYFLEKTKDIVPNWLLAVPDPNASVGVKAEPFKIEIVVRGILVGHAWREYKAGKRELCGVAMPDGLKEYDAFPAPIITPSTKAEAGHDEDISAEQIIAQNLATADEWQQLSTYALALFARGQEMAQTQGLVLADTKYEFGRYNGKIILIDEVHTPDSSRYFFADTYEAYLKGSEVSPKHFSKEFVREWLLANNFDGHSDQPVPEMTDDFVKMTSDRYIELFEKVTGQTFVKADYQDAAKRIETNLITYLETKS